MTTWLTRSVAVLFLVLPFVPVVADDPDDAEIARLVKQLGSTDFRMRAAATKRLKEIGEPAFGALHQATTSNDVEASRRAEEILVVIENKLYPELVLRGHTSEVWCVSISADGKRVLTSSADTTLRLWDADTGKCLRLFEGHTARIVSAALSPDGRRVLSGGSGDNDKTVRLWDATTGKELHKMIGHTGTVDGVAFGPEGMAISAGDRTMHLWDLKTGKKAGVLTGHTDFVHNVAYADKAKLAATCSYDTSIRLWNLETGKELGKLTGHSDHIASVCFSLDGKRLLSAAVDNTVRIWDVKSGTELKRIQAAGAYYAAFSPDGNRIVTGGYHDFAVRVWDSETGKELRKYEGHKGIVTGVAFLPDGKRVASASADGTIRIWRAPR
jgi:WD40 repeat protein